MPEQHGGHDRDHDHDGEDDQGDRVVLAPRVEVEDAGAWKRTLRIQVPAESVKAQYEDMLKDLAKTAQVPGFRKGHVPRVRLLKQFADALAGDVKHRLLGKAIDEALKISDLEAVGEPTIEPLAAAGAGAVPEGAAPGAEAAPAAPAPVTERPAPTGEEAGAAEGAEKLPDLDAIKLDLEGPFSFQVTVEVKPKFEIPRYRGLRLERRRRAISDERVDEHIKALRRSEADYVPVTGGGARPGDRLTVAGRLEVEGARAWEAEHETCFLDEYLLVGLPARARREEVEGIAPGEERSFDVKVPDDCKDEALRGRDAKLVVRVEELKRPEVPPLTDDAAREYGATDAADLRSRVRARLEAQADAAAREGLQAQVVDRLVEAAGIELPAGMLEREARTNEVRQIVRLAQMGIRPDALEADHMERIREGVRGASERGLKARLIFEKIAEAEKIEVTDDDLEEEILRYASATRSTPVAVRSRLQREGMLDSLRGELISAKVVNFLVERADIIDVPGEPAAGGQGAPGGGGA